MLEQQETGASKQQEQVSATRNKKKKNDEILMLAKCKLNSIEKFHEENKGKCEEFEWELRRKS